MVKRGDQQRIALWGTVVLVSLYLVLTGRCFCEHRCGGARHTNSTAPSSLLQEQECSPTRRKDDPTANLQLLGGAFPFPCWG